MKLTKYYFYKNRDNGLFYAVNDNYTSRMYCAIHDCISNFSSTEDALHNGSLKYNNMYESTDNVEVLELEVLEFENYFIILDDYPDKIKEGLRRKSKEVIDLEDRIYDLTCEIEDLLRQAQK